MSLRSDDSRLAVWSRHEVVRVDFEEGGIVCPGVADGLEGGTPA